MEDIKYKPIHAISLMFAVGCNLSCEYCLIHQSRYNEKFIQEMRQNTIKALDDGSYLNNILKVIDKLHGDPNDIFQIDLWGQEPTLQMEYFTNHIKDWLQAFPNLKGIFFSTNGVAYWEKIYDLAIALDNNLDHKLLLRFQWSYDGSYSTSQLRHGNGNKIIENYKNLITKLNQHKFYHLQIDTILHGVTSFSLVREFDGDLDKIKEYYAQCNKTAEEVASLCYNDSIHVNHAIAFGEETPYRCSTEEGLAWYDFIMKLMIAEQQYGHGATTLINSIYRDAVKNAMHDEELMSYETFDDFIIDLCTRLIPSRQDISRGEYADGQDVAQHLSDHFYCGTGIGEVKVLYDGTLINCQNSIYEKDVEHINPEITIANEVKRSQSRAKVVFVNPLTDPQELVDKYLYLFHTGRDSSFWHIFSSTCQKMQLMAFCGQVSPIYLENDFLLVKHAFIITFVNQCTYNNGILTGSYFSRDTGLIRRYANGLLLAEDALGKIDSYIFHAKQEKRGQCEC